MNDPVDILGIGNALVDLLVEVDDAFIARHRLPRGDMLLCDAERFAAVHAEAGPPRSVAHGGNAGNTSGAAAAFGLRARFIGKVAEDALGDLFRRELASAGVTYDTVALPQGPLATASCLILVTPDGQRTGVTHLGACGELDAGDVSEDAVAAARLTFLEAYLLDCPRSAAALHKAAALARPRGRALALTLSDPTCVARHRGEILDLLRAGAVDILFGNASEAIALTGAAGLDAAVAALRVLAPALAITRGAAGALVVANGAEFEIAAAPARVVDTTGAGDHFAAGFLVGWLAGLSPARAGSLGAQAAAAVIGHLGAKPRGKPLRPA
jgi:sugar/nucleoside kinase (ribokinase family)